MKDSSDSDSPPGDPLIAPVRALVDQIDGLGELVAMERLSGGASQETYRLTVATAQGEMPVVLRRAPDGVEAAISAEAPGLGVEAKLLVLARAGGVPVPEVLHVCDGDDGGAVGAGMLLQWLDGETLGSRIIRSAHLAAVRPTLARSCGEILAKIHALDVTGSGVGQDLGSFDPADLVRDTWDRYEALDVAQPMIDYTGRWLSENLPPSRPQALVHGDFRNGNLMISEAGVIGVLDWELAHLGDPMRDLGWLCTGSWRFGEADQPVGGFGTYAELFAGYEAVSGVEVDAEVVRFWEVFGSFWWSVGCLGMVAGHRLGIDPSVERLAIGRRSSECQMDCVNLIIPGPAEAVIDPSPDAAGEMPEIGELLSSVAGYLRDDVAAGPAAPRARYLARVSANVLEIVRRDHHEGGMARANERDRLVALLAATSSGVDDAAPLDRLRRRLVRDLRTHRIPLDADGLAAHLRATVAGQLAIDQPAYVGVPTTAD